MVQRMNGMSSFGRQRGNRGLKPTPWRDVRDAQRSEIDYAIGKGRTGRRDWTGTGKWQGNKYVTELNPQLEGALGTMFGSFGQAQGGYGQLADAQYNPLQFQGRLADLQAQDRALQAPYVQQMRESDLARSAAYGLAPGSVAAQRQTQRVEDQIARNQMQRDIGLRGQLAGEIQQGRNFALQQQLAGLSGLSGPANQAVLAGLGRGLQTERGQQINPYDIGSQMRFGDQFRANQRAQQLENQRYMENLRRQEEADRASGLGSLISGGLGLVGTALGGPLGGMLGSALGGATTSGWSPTVTRY